MRYNIKEYAKAYTLVFGVVGLVMAPMLIILQVLGLTNDEPFKPLAKILLTFIFGSAYVAIFYIIKELKKDTNCTKDEVKE